MAMRTGPFSPLLAPGYRKIYFDEQKDRPQEWRVGFNQLTSKRGYEDDYRMGGFNAFPEKPEGTSIIYQDAIPGGQKRYVWTPRGSGFRITFEMHEDDLYKIAGPRMTKELSKSAMYQMEVDNWGLYNDAFTGTLYKGFDGLALMSASHTRLDGGTVQPNMPSVQVDISCSALQAANTTIHKWVDDVGRYVQYIPKLLLINPDDVFIADEVLHTQFYPTAVAAAGSEVVPLQKIMKLSYFICHYFTDSDMWFLMCDHHDINHFWRNLPMYQNGDDFDSGDAKFKSYYRDGRGFGRWQGIYGSSGG